MGEADRQDTHTLPEAIAGPFLRLSKLVHPVESDWVGSFVCENGRFEKLELFERIGLEMAISARELDRETGASSTSTTVLPPVAALKGSRRQGKCQILTATHLQTNQIDSLTSSSFCQRFYRSGFSCCGSCCG